MAFSKYPPLMYLAAGLIVGGLVMGGFYFWQAQTPSVPEPFHVHADFALFINGEKFDFAHERYMATSENKLSGVVHLHDGVGNIVHFHAENISIQLFLESLHFGVNDTCMTTDTNLSYCADDTRSWKVWVNGAENEKGFDYVPEDLDQILISFGNETVEQLQGQFSLVSDEACIQSETCPERGAPSDESTCAGSGACDVGYIPIGN